MLKREVEEAGVQEAAGDEPVPLAVGDRRAREAEVVDRPSRRCC